MKHLPFVAAIVLAACAPGWNDPLPMTPTADNPCGASYVPCLNMAGDLSGMCCVQHYTCGGGKFSVGCSAGECCFIGSPTGGFGARPNMQQISIEEARKSP